MSLPVQSLGLGDTLKSYSCFTCRQRKVRCDRRSPCSNCVKTEKQCSFIPPVRGKRKRTKPLREGLHAKLKRYEELLRSHGVKVEPSSDDGEDSDSEAASQHDTEMKDVVKPRSKFLEMDDSNSKLITKEGSSRYFDSAPWSKLGEEFQHPEMGDIDEPIEESNTLELGIFFEPESNHKPESLISLHPSSQALPKLREIYADRVDPWIKILHLPTFWAALTDGVRHPQIMPKSLEAALFAFYLATVSALSENECQEVFGAQKEVIYSRYRAATRQALVNARFLSTSSQMTLRAFTLFIMCVRNTYRVDTLFVLSGIAIRLARKMGLHRDGTSLGLSPFDTEMRRRLWWHLVRVDFRTADVLGTRPSMDLSSGDTRKPLNVEDEDLNPDMVDQPPERNGITSMTLCLIQCETMETLQRFSTSSPGNVRWEILFSGDISVAKKDSIINQIEDHMERKYLRYCDPSNSLHIMASIMIRSSLCKMKLFAHTRRQFANNATQTSQRERNIVFENAIKLLEYVALLKGGQHGLEKYMWQIGTSYLWNAILYVLIETRHRKTGSEVNRSWQLIGEVLSHYPQVFEQCSGSVYTALGKWILEVWDNYVTASNAEGIPEPLTPAYISAIRQCRRPETGPNHPSSDSGPPTGASLGDRCESNLTDVASFVSYDFPDLLSFETDPNEWVQWEQLIAKQELVQVDGM
ncbi:C6 transcription factor, putative [Talaromyces stipitatus ATCC 10500]|uniref:C6 transcription factor, putative n=1 Tax=Talaromyces stipitatus (strain ATCC 10500 / CBS 375.48 / QM 6759 / NRRL 1006) TaxID=441959 RepID=B8MBB5_TALSN|nr:C6 transcription factor, putative [Talaromyces stipitatus ATCC 10500]EED18904.1 C6 transcription factor, putative [Talaromyces stipitatus ATCC 10500]